jgi:uracil-DNA glycosylase
VPGVFATDKKVKNLEALHRNLKKCRKCPDMCGRAVFARPLKTKLMLVGQAPGIHEEVLGKPFAHTAGKTLFKWFNESIGATENEVREMIYFTAVARCFPGKAKSGKGDRPPSKLEIENCSTHLKNEINLIKPDVIIAVGKIAISELLKGEGKKAAESLDNLVGKTFETKIFGRNIKVIPLPHPSGVSRWPHTETGKARLQEAFGEIRRTVSTLL